MRSPRPLPMRDSFGSKDIGDRQVTITSGSRDIGSVLLLKGHTGRIRTTTTIRKAGNGTKDTGTTRTTTTTIGATTIASGGIAMTTTKGMSTTTNLLADGSVSVTKGFEAQVRSFAGALPILGD